MNRGVGKCLDQGENFLKIVAGFKAVNLKKKLIFQRVLRG